MFKKEILWFLPVLVIGCIIVFMFRTKKTEAATVTTKTYLLSKDALYNKDSINNALDEATTDNEWRGKKIFLQALDKFKNKKQVNGSIALFRESLMIFPNAIGYYELGNALLTAGIYDEAEKCFNSADHLHYSPSYMTTYKQACLLIKKGNVQEGFNYLESAIEGGYTDREEFMTDPNLAAIRNTDEYNLFLANNFEEDKDKRMMAMFDIYLKNFPDVGLPYEIDETHAADFDNDKSISYYYTDYIDGMEDGRFSRDVTNEYSYVAKLYKNEKFTALLYSSLEAMADTLAPVTTLLVTYDSLGKPVDKLVFACQCSPEQVRAGVFNEDKTIQVKEFKRNWQFDPRAKGYQGNSITGYDLQGIKTYTLTDDGHIKEASPSTEEPALEVAKSGFLW
jgi:tetratricopeptide (TPR) repeat protein